VFNCYAQKQISLKGIVFFKNTPLNQVHIYNINTAKGILSNRKGEFEIDVSVNDVLVVNIMPYREKKIKIVKGIFNKRSIKINLKENVTDLDLVEVSNKKLTGNLALDSKKVPVSVNQQFKITINIDASSLNSFSESGSGIDRGSSEVRNGGINSIGAGGNILGVVGLLVDVIRPHKKYIRKKSRLFTEETPSIMHKELGDDFFIKELKIPKPHIDDFLDEYCNIDKFINLYEENKLIECIEFLIIKNKLGKYCLDSN
jgi:hypothetical protein